ncbi:odorant receptor 67a [Diachasma alloeum]|uniref:Odorant receptor n=1 Tax=Diachasma alloeum TaxID=454923 RepID=A0A4E0S4E3_9HYME|nr:odorant receptor 67a [Diachasma alloeum]THK32893.1 odorant receptor 104 [Diachasma alloeum]
MKTSILSLNFFVLQIMGFWRPPHWSSPLKIIIYNFYSCLMCFVLYSVTVSQLIEMIRSPGTVDDFINNSRVLLTMMNACAKSLSFITRRVDILRAIDIIATPPCSPRSAAEAAIQEKYDRSIRTNSIIYGTFIQTSVNTVILQTAMECIPNRILPFKSWIPYEINSDLTFWLTYMQQTVATYVTSYVNICYDTIVPGCMVQTCAQLQIFKSRLKDLCEHDCENNKHSGLQDLEYDDSVDKKLVSNCVEHHLKILKFAELSNSIFTSTIFTQFGISSLVICVSVYDLSKAAPFSPYFVEVILYLMSMMLEIYLFCFYGHNVTVESSRIGSDIYDLDWVSLKIPVQKSLLIIMTRSMKPLIFTSGHVVVLSLASFTSLLKMSYSAYNVLQQAS